jgi:hypothetical protein
MRLRLATLVLALIVFRAGAVSACESFLDPKKRSVVDFAPPAGFIEICSRDSLACEIFTMAERSTVREKIVGYFVTEEQWEQFRNGAPMGFSPYLIALRVETLSSEQFTELKADTRKKQGHIWDDTDLPDAQKPLLRVPMGVIDEAADSISVGAVAQVMAPSREAFEKGRFISPAEKALAQKNGEAVEEEMTIGSVHTVLRLKGETLFLNTYEPRDQPFDGASTKALARQWLECVRDKNGN